MESKAYEGSYESLKANLVKLRRHEAELLKEIDSINESFNHLGVPAALLHGDDASRSSVDPVKAAGITMRSKLSFRGRDKAKEYFRFVDLDGDELLHYADLRAMHSFGHSYGMFQSPAYQSEAAWLAYMKDGGYPIQDGGALSIPAYLAYRTNIESRQSLAYELCSLRLGLLPKELQHWGLLKQHFRQLDHWRQERRAHSKEEMARLTGRLTFEEVQFIANISGLQYTRSELTLLLLGIYNKRKLNDQLLRIYSRLHISEDDYQFKVNSEGRLVVNRHEEKVVFSEPTQFIAEELQEISTNEFLAWALSCPLLVNMKSVYRRLMSLKYAFLYTMRTLDSYSRWVFSLGAHCNDRMIFRDFPPLGRLLRKFQLISTYKALCYINTSSAGSGEAGSSLHGLGCNVKLMRVDNPEATIKKLGAPPSSGSVIYFDILLKDLSEGEAKDKPPAPSQTSPPRSKPPTAAATTDPSVAPPAESEEDKELQELVRLLHLFLQHHFEKDLKNSNNLLNNLQVQLTTNELDDAKVIRVMMSYKKLVNIDKFLEYLIIPYKLNEVISSLSLDLRTNIDLQDLCTHNKLQSLSEVLSCTMSATGAIRRNIVAALAERVVLACSSGLSHDQANAAAAAAASAPGSSVASQTSGHGSHSSPSHSGLPSASSAGEEEDLRALRWQQLTPFYPRLASFFQQIHSYFSTVKTSTLRYQFRSVAELYDQVELWTQGHIRQHLSRSFLTEPGRVRKAFLEWVETWRRELREMFTSLQRMLADKKKEADALAWRQLLLAHGPTKNHTGKSVTSTVDEQSLESTGILHFVHEQALHIISAQFREQTDQEILSLRLIEKLLKYTVGIHAIEAMSGKNKLSFLFQGCDLVELVQIATGGSLLPGSMQEEYDKAYSKKRVLAMDKLQC